MRKATAPSRVIHVEASGVRTPVAIARLSALAEFALKAQRVARCELSVTLVSSRRMATINQQHLAHRGPTDVITFALEPDPSGVLQADIYICPDVARDQARQHGAGVREEIMRLVVHGVLHATGHDHPVDESRTSSAMWKRQELLLSRFLELPPW